MRLVTDTNILVRCSRGKAARRVAAWRRNGVHLVTTERNAREMTSVLRAVFGLEEGMALAETARVLRPFEIVDDGDYVHLRERALARLREGGRSDWPALAAAMALDGAIWSEDIDFFGVGIPVWSTRNVLIAAEA